jgi:S-(hydroxymethyl)glutathione dehydrogenase/alcohol dehydrogenase
MIIAVDINPARLEFAKQFGATHTLLASKNDKGLIEASKEKSSLRGADYAFERTAVPELVRLRLRWFATAALRLP